MTPEEELREKLKTKNRSWPGSTGEHLFIRTEDVISIAQSYASSMCKRQKEEIEAYEWGINVVKKEIERQEEMIKTFSNNSESVAYHTAKARWFRLAIEIISKNKEMFLKHPEIRPAPLAEEVIK